MFDYGAGKDDADGLKRQVDMLKEELEDEKSKIVNRDRINGDLMAINSDLIDNIEDLEKQLADKSTQHDNKAMAALDISKQCSSLVQSNKDLQAEVGRLSMDAAVTWQDGLVKFLTKMVDKRIAEACNEMDYWSHH